MVQFKITLESDGTNLSVYDFDEDEDLKIKMYDGIDEPYSIYICREQAIILRDHLLRIIK